MTITQAAQVAVSVGWNGDPNDQVFQVAWKAAEGYVSVRCTWPTTDADGAELPAPAELVEAVTLLTGRFLDRRNSPNGLVGFGDLGAARLPSQDVDVRTLIGPYRSVVFG